MPREPEGPELKREVCYLIDASQRVLWSDASTSPAALPDSRERWEAIWRLRGELAEIAHSHPVGPLAFSHEDETTMAALTAALGPTRPLRFSIVAPGGMLARIDGADVRITDEPPWAAHLRIESGMHRNEEGREEKSRGQS
jgi:hypothetical protein